MFVSADISGQGTTGLTIPATSLLSTGTRNIVWVEIADNVFERREVTIGTANEGRVEVASGLRDNEAVVARGMFLLDSESQLEGPADGSNR